jgi:hypothetical protein
MLSQQTVVFPTGPLAPVRLQESNVNNPGSCISRDKDIVTREVAGETIIVPIKGRVGDLDSIYTLNEVGTFIWQHLGSEPTVSQLVDAVVGEYHVGAEEAEKDVECFLGSLEDTGLIKRRDIEI